MANLDPSSAVPSGPHAPVGVITPQALYHLGIYGYALRIGGRARRRGGGAGWAGPIVRDARGVTAITQWNPMKVAAGRVAGCSRTAACGGSSRSCCGSRFWLGPLGGIDMQ